MMESVLSRYHVGSGNKTQVLRLSSKTLYPVNHLTSPDPWPWTSDTLASTSKALGLQACTTMASLYSARDWTHGASSMLKTSTLTIQLYQPLESLLFNARTNKHWTCLFQNNQPTIPESLLENAESCPTWDSESGPAVKRSLGGSFTHKVEVVS